MKAKQALLILSVAALAASAVSSSAQPFQSGSNGSYGAINVTANATLDVPPDGIFHCTTININTSRTLTFRRNVLNTPVYLLATGDVTISGFIAVDGGRGTASAPGLSGPGGFDGGAPGSVGQPSGDGKGPGGGKAGDDVGDGTEAGGAGHATATTAGPAAKRGGTYGNPLLLALVGGSGGGGASGAPGWGGGGGGGAILIASSTRINLTGGIFARGGQAMNGSVLNTGSGGAVRLVAPVVSGAGTINVYGDLGAANRGDGRIRVDSLDRSGISFNFDPDTTASVGGLMVTFPSPQPRLDIVEAAGRAIPLDSGPAQVLLPAGSSANQTVKIRAAGFGQIVPIRVVLTPDSGSSQSYDAQIDNSGPNPAEATVNVVFPFNVLTHIQVWTR